MAKTVQTRGVMRDGVRVGKWIEYTTSGFLRRSADCGDGKGADATSYMDDEAFDELRNLDKDSDHCQLEVFDPTTRRITMLRSPTRRVEYWNNGNKRIEADLRDGKPYGTRTSWRKDGSLESRAQITGDIMHLERFGKNGRLRERGTFVDKRPDGLHQSWDQHGRPLSRVHYRAGTVHGPAHLFDVALGEHRDIEFVLNHVVSSSTGLCKATEELDIDVDPFPDDELELEASI